MDEKYKEKFTETDNLIIKIILIMFIIIITFLVTLIIFKIAIEKKIIFKLSKYI